ncbi:hypothetical protein BZL30_1697 [Mycobacterium kansasii]|uniref:Uncharacterized protein n=1 Tax=Mycobacterium kansasii TaxID=1768 RepID=A0A1V3XHM3_MYCKA|nr:hypothetical protein BZL30_1697 [Mycobacterium kansasii]
MRFTRGRELHPNNDSHPLDGASVRHRPLTNGWAGSQPRHPPIRIDTTGRRARNDAT